MSLFRWKLGERTCQNFSREANRRGPAACAPCAERATLSAFPARLILTAQHAAPTVPYAMNSSMITLRNVEKFFEHGPTKTYVLRRINLDIKEGDFISIMGPSGAGKSTLLHLLGMHDTAWTGDYNFLEFPIHRLNKKDRSEVYKKYIGFVFQSYHLLDSLTVYENLDIPLSYRNIKKSERQSIVCDSLDRFSMVGKKDLYPNQLSGGQQQLVAIARAMIASPKVILADEPTGNLHSSPRQRNHGNVQEAERRRYHHHSGNA